METFTHTVPLSPETAAAVLHPAPDYHVRSIMAGPCQRCGERFEVEPRGRLSIPSLCTACQVKRDMHEKRREDTLIEAELCISCHRPIDSFDLIRCDKCEAGWYLPPAAV